LESAGCSHSFNRQVDFGSNRIKLSVICFENEDNVIKYEKRITLAGDANIDETILNSEESDSELELKIPKKNGQSYWAEIIKAPTERDVVWKSVHDYYYEEVNDLKEK